MPGEPEGTRARYRQPRDRERFVAWLADRALGMPRGEDYFVTAPAGGTAARRRPLQLLRRRRATSSAGSSSTAAASVAFRVHAGRSARRSPSPRRSTPSATAELGVERRLGDQHRLPLQRHDVARPAASPTSTASTPSSSATRTTTSTRSLRLLLGRHPGRRRSRGTTTGVTDATRRRDLLRHRRRRHRHQPQHRVLLQRQPEQDQGGRGAVRPRAGAHPGPRPLLRRPVAPLRPPGADVPLHPRRRPGRPLHRRRPRRRSPISTATGSAAGGAVQPAGGGALGDPGAADLDRQLRRRDRLPGAASGGRRRLLDARHRCRPTPCRRRWAA